MPNERGGAGAEKA
jgi:arsenate reductase (thioredoxin)